jgi:hypothetical protein
MEYRLTMKSSSLSDSNLLTEVGHRYLDMFHQFRSPEGYLDSEKWNQTLEVDYVLEVIGANLSYVNLICEKVIEDLADKIRENQNSLAPDYDDGEDFMPDYDMGYRLAEDCTSVVSFAMRNNIKVRSSLLEELFYAHILYMNLSVTAGRRGWLDVNKRMCDSMITLIQCEPKNEEILESWGQPLEDIEEEDLHDPSFHPALRWKKTFFEALFEELEDDKS